VLAPESSEVPKATPPPNTAAAATTPPAVIARILVDLGIAALAGAGL
jgi:hypothetical protein